MSAWSGPITYPRARKTYACAACGKPIEKGQRHERWMGRGEYETTATTGRAHLLCQALELGRDDDFPGYFEYTGDGRDEFFRLLTADGIEWDDESLIRSDADYDDLFLDAVRMFDFLAGLARLARLVRS